MLFSYCSTSTWGSVTCLSQMKRSLSESGLSCTLTVSSIRVIRPCAWFWTAVKQARSLKASMERMYALVSYSQNAWCIMSVYWCIVVYCCSTFVCDVTCRWRMVSENALPSKHGLWEPVLTEEAQGEESLLREGSGVLFSTFIFNYTWISEWQYTHEPVGTQVENCWYSNSTFTINYSSLRTPFICKYACDCCIKVALNQPFIVLLYVYPSCLLYRLTPGFFMAIWKCSRATITCGTCLWSQVWSSTFPILWQMCTEVARREVFHFETLDVEWEYFL